MTLESLPLLKAERKNYLQLFNVRNLALIVTIGLLISLGIYNYLSVIERQSINPGYLDDNRNDYYAYESETPGKITTEHNSGTINQALSGKGELEIEFNRRRKYIQQKCIELNLTNNEKPNAWEFLINTKYHLIYCNVFKAASTSWLYDFMLLAGIDQMRLEQAFKTDSPVAVTRKIYPRPSVQRLQQQIPFSTSFMIVRHPFERLVSAYKNKFIDHVVSDWYRAMGTEILKKTKIWDDVSTFVNGSIKAEEFPPTFEDLVTYILCQWHNDGVIDEHWRSMSDFCTPCAVPFNYTLKFERLEEEQEFLINQMNLTGVIKPEWKNPSPDMDIKATTREYFSQISKKQILGLFEYYREDFELFQYFPDEYLKYGKEVHTQLPCRPISGHSKLP